MNLYRLFVACSLGGMIAWSVPTHSQGGGSAASYPSKPVSVVIPFPAGGITDSETRLYTDKLQASLGQPFVFDFRGGASSSIGVTHTLRAPPDGYTIMITNTSLSVFPNFHPTLTDKDVSQLIPITELSNRSTALLVSPAALPNVQSMRDLVAYAKANPGKLSCNTNGAGSGTHIVCAALAEALGVSIQPVHYKGVSQGQVDLIAGRVQVSGGTLFAAMSHIKSGKLRPIALFASDRSKLMPELPTVIEQGYDVLYPSWQGAFAPPKTPQPIVEKLHIEMVKAVRSPDVVAALEKSGSTPIGSNPEEFRRKFTAEVAYWKGVITTNKIQSTQ